MESGVWECGVWSAALRSAHVDPRPGSWTNRFLEAGPGKGGDPTNGPEPLRNEHFLLYKTVFLGGLQFSGFWPPRPAQVAKIVFRVLFSPCGTPGPAPGRTDSSRPGPGKGGTPQMARTPLEMSTFCSTKRCFWAACNFPVFGLLGRPKWRK